MTCKSWIRRSRRIAFRVVGSVLVLASVTLCVTSCGERIPREDEQSARPNILFILTDEHRFDLVGCYGNDELRTPHLDALAAEGARFEGFYVAAPLCSPSRASFLSGLYPHQSGVMDNTVRADFAEPVPPTVASVLRAAGYRTLFVGKAHMGGDPKRWGFEDVPVLLPGGGAKFDAYELVYADGARSVEGPATGHFVDEAVRFLEVDSGERPWFLWLSTRAAHRPYVTDYEAAPDFGYVPGSISPPPGWPPNQPLSDHDWAGYYATVTYLDEQIGRVLAALDKSGARENTLVFFAGDNGSMYGSHGEARKEVWYDECARTPAIVRWPGHVDGGTVVDSLVSSVDFLPTLRDVCAIDPDPSLEGKSFLPALRGEGATRRLAYSELERREKFGGGYWQMIRDARYKYVRFDDGTEHLYDFELDTWEVRDFAGEASHAEALERMRGELDAWREQTKR